ncbi:MAG: thioredoxin family protein [bacterium]
MMLRFTGRNILPALLLLCCVLAGASQALAAEATSFAEAKQLSAAGGLPILFEFYRSDCEYCERSEREAQSNESVKLALTRVVHYHCNVKDGEGIELSEKYEVGFTYPVFLLTDATGEPISRWIGFSNASRLITKLSDELKDLTPIAARETRLKTAPNVSDALKLAGYYADAMKYDKSVAAYRKAQEVGGTRSDYSYQIFYQAANAAWNEMMPFAEVLPAADAALTSSRVGVPNKLKVVELLARLARKSHRTEVLGPYLDKGIALTASDKSNSPNEKHANFLADQALHIEGDTAQAIQLKKQGLGPGWENDMQKCYGFARWCLEREINLPEAETYCRSAAQTVPDLKAKAQIYGKLGEILAAEGKYADAVDALLLSVENDPTHEFYHTQLKEYNDSLEARQ